MQSTLREKDFTQLDAMLVKLKEVQSQLVLKNEELVTLNNQDAMATPELLRLRMQNAYQTAGTTELESVSTES